MLSRDMLREPFFLIIINGEPIPPEYHQLITEVSVEDTDKEPSEARISIEEGVERYFANNTSIVKGASIVIYMGHRFNYRKMLTGKITQVEITFNESGTDSVDIQAVDNETTMTDAKKTRKWENIKKSDVVSLIVAEYGWTPHIQDTSHVEPQISQNNETDREFITRLAKELGFKNYLVDDIDYYFGDRDYDAKAEDTLEYYCGECSVISFTFQYSEKSTDTTSNSSDIDTNSGKDESSDVKDKETNITVTEHHVNKNSGLVSALVTPGAKSGALFPVRNIEEEE